MTTPAEKCNEIRNALCDPAAPWYGSDLVPLVDDCLSELTAQLAEAQQALAQREGELAKYQQWERNRKEQHDSLNTQVPCGHPAEYKAADNGKYLCWECECVAERTAHEATLAELAEARRERDEAVAGYDNLISYRDCLESQLTAAQSREAKLREANAKLFAACQWVLTSDAGYDLVSCALDLPEGVWIESGGDSIEVAAALSPPDRREQIAARVPSGEELEGGARGLEILE